MKRLMRILTLSLACAAAVSLAACSNGESSSSEVQTTAAETDATHDEAASDIKTARDVNLTDLHAINYDGNEFAGAWHITERDEGETYRSFTYVFDGDSTCYLMMGSMGYISNYDDADTKKQTKLEKYMSFSCIPLPEADAKIDSELVGAWKDDSGGFLYFDDQGIMYETQKGLSFTFYNYSAEDGKVSTKCFMPDETNGSAEYSVDGDKLTYNNYQYERIDSSELV